MATEFDDLADAIRELVSTGARRASPPVQRFEVLAPEPLVIQALNGDEVLEEGDPDVELDRTLTQDRPEVGDVVRVHFDGDAYIVSGVVA